MMNLRTPQTVSSERSIVSLASILEEAPRWCTILFSYYAVTIVTIEIKLLPLENLELIDRLR